MLNRQLIIMINVVFLQTNSLVYLAPILIYPFLLMLMVVVVVIIILISAPIKIVTMTTVVGHVHMRTGSIQGAHLKARTEGTPDHRSEGDTDHGPTGDPEDPLAAILTSVMDHHFTWAVEEVA